MTDILSKIFTGLKSIPEMSSYDPITFYTALQWEPSHKIIQGVIRETIEKCQLSIDIKENKRLVERMIVSHLLPKERLVTLALLDTIEPSKRLDHLLNNLNLVTIYPSLNKENKQKTIVSFYQKIREEIKETDAIEVFRRIFEFANLKNWPISSFNKIVKVMNENVKLFNDHYDVYGEDGYPISPETEVERLRKELEQLRQNPSQSCTTGLVNTYLTSFFHPR